MVDANPYDNEAIEEEKEEEEEENAANNDLASIKHTKVPLLFKEIHKGNVEAVQEILNHTKGFINSATHNCLTPLHTACHLQQLDILKLLITHGAKVNCCDNKGNTVLHTAVAARWYDGIEELLQQGASPNEMSKPTTTLHDLLKETPLHAAVRMGDKIATTLLLKSQPNLHIRDSKNNSIFHLAASSYTHLPILKQLFAEEHSTNQLKDIKKDGYSLFHAALSEEITVRRDLHILKVIQTIYKFGDNFNQVNLLGETPLILACRAGLPKVVRFFLANGADPTKVTHEGQSTLHAACMSGCTTALRHLLSTGRVNHLISRRDNHSHHPFYFAATSASIDCCKILLDNGEHLANSFKGVSNCSLVIEKLPNARQLFTDMFDSCVKPSKKPQNDPNYNITFNYSPLMSEKENIQSSIVFELANTPLEFLLKHPLIESFLHIKWRHSGKVFYIYCFEYLVYLILHSVFVVLTFGKDEVKWTQHPGTLAAFTWLHVVLLLFTFLPGFLVTFANYKEYFRQVGTYSSFLSFLSSAIVIIMKNIAILPNDAEEATNLTLSYDRMFASMSLFFGWSHLMMLLSRFPAVGPYILMFTKVAKSIFKFLLFFSCILMGFALSFHILFREMPVFDSVPLSIVKTLTMMTGGIAYSEFVEKEKTFSIYGLVVLCVFLFMVTVIMSNMLIGLTVNDLPELKKKGKIKRLGKQVSYLMAYEKLTVFAHNMKIFPRKLHQILLSQCTINPLITVWPNTELKKYKHQKTIPADTLQEAMKLGSCEHSEDFLTMDEEDISTHMKAFHIKYSSDRRTQKDTFSDLGNKCDNIQKQIDQMQEKINSWNICDIIQKQTDQLYLKLESRLSLMQIQTQQHLQQNQNLYLTENQSGQNTQQDPSK